MQQAPESTVENVLDVNELALELYELKEKYERLKDGHRKLISVNQNLEDKLLQSINRYETEKSSLLHTISNLDSQLDDLQRINHRLLAENERFKLDISVATQLLHCKSSSFASVKLQDLPEEFQCKARHHMQQEWPRYHPQPASEKKSKVIRVPISAFPATTMIYSIPSVGMASPSPVLETFSFFKRHVGAVADDNEDSHSWDLSEVTVSAATMAKVLEERQRDLHPMVTYSNGTGDGAGDRGPIGLRPSPAIPSLGDMHHVDHGTQTYPHYIGEHHRTRNNCIFCQGTPSGRCDKSNMEKLCAPNEPKVFVYTESETSPLARNGGTSKANRRKVQAKNADKPSDSSTRLVKAVETDI